MSNGLIRIIQVNNDENYTIKNGTLAYANTTPKFILLLNKNEEQRLSAGLLIKGEVVYRNDIFEVN